MTSSAGSGFPGRLFRAEVERKSALSAHFPPPNPSSSPSQAQATMSQVDDYDESNYSQVAEDVGAWSPTEATPSQGLQEGGDDGMGSPVRQFYTAKSKPKSKAAPKEKKEKKEKKERKSRAKGPAAKKPMEVAKENMLKKRKAAAAELAAEVDASAPKATKRARTMQTKAAAMAETSSASGTPLMNKIESLLKHADEQDACVTALVDEEDVNQFLSRTYSDVLGVFSASMSGAPLTPLTEEVDSDFEVVDIPDTPPPAPTRARTAPSRRPSLAPSASASASPPRAEGDHFGKLWGPWALEARDRAGQQGRASLVEAERKLMQYYAVPFEVWASVPEGTHTKYTTLKRYGAKPEDEDFADRRVVHAVVQGAIAGGKPGRMCMGWKSDKAPWPRGDHDSFNWYLQRGALPQGWKAPGSR